MHIAQNWRINAQRYSMKGHRCEKCQKVTFPPREVCPYCAATNVIDFSASDSRVIELPEALVLQRAGR